MAERYHNGLPEDEKRGWKLSERIKGISKGQAIDCRQAFQRFTVESILWALQKTSDVDFMVKGGLLYRQTERQTDDADIQYFTPLGDKDVLDAMEAAARHLWSYGIFWQPLHVETLDMGGKGAGYRIPIVAKIGPTRIDTHIDVGFGALPDGAVRRQFTSMFKGPSFTAWAQPWEAVVADKVAAILTLGMTNTRLKDYRDLLVLRCKNLDDRRIARALHKTMRERHADMRLLLGIPDGLSFEFADAQRWNWRAFAAEDGGLPLDFLDVVCTLRHWHADIQDRLFDLAAADALEPCVHVPSAEGNVVNLSEYRMRMRA